MSAQQEKDAFQKIIAETASEDLACDVIAYINSVLTDLQRTHANDTALPRVHAEDIADILVTAGIDGDVQLKTLADSFDKLVGLKGLTAANLTDKDITVTADDIRLCISARSADKMQAQIINNRPCIVIRLDSPRIDVNGYSVMIK